MSTLTLMGAGPEAGGSFSPLSLSPTVWYDFSGLGLADGTAIASISDLSGNGNTASQATGANQPIFKTAIQNGLGIGRGNGTTQELHTAAFTAVNLPITVYAVVSGAGNRYFGTQGTLRAGWDATPEANNFNGGGPLIGNTGTPTTSVAFKVVTSVFNGVSSVIRINGTQVAAGTVGTNDTTMSQVIVFAQGATAAAQWWAGDIGEIFVVAGSSPSAQAENYLRTKWGTA